MKQYDIGIDLGTTSIIIATEEQGVVFRQPTKPRNPEAWLHSLTWNTRWTLSMPPAWA